MSDGINIGIIIGPIFGFITFLSFFVAIYCSCRWLGRQARDRKLAVEETARQYHQSIIDDGGRYDPQRDKYVNTRGEVYHSLINVGPGMAIIG